MEIKKNNDFGDFKRKKFNRIKRIISYMFLYLGYFFISWVTEFCFDTSATEIGVFLCSTLLFF